MKLVLAGLLMAMGFAGSGCASVNRLWGGGEKKTATIQSARFSDVLGEAELGDERAQFSLGEMYRKGVGVGQNFSEAYAWYSIAAMNGHAGAEAMMRAGWAQKNIARGKVLVEILRDRYPNAVIP
jgi:hypothetical protein